MSESFPVSMLRRLARERGVRVEFIDGLQPWAIRKRAGDPPMRTLPDREAVDAFLHTLPKVPAIRH